MGRDVNRDYAPKERDSRDYGSRDNNSNRGYGDRSPRDTGYSDRVRNNQDSDWDW
jgi:hypothetical protein